MTKFFLALVAYAALLFSAPSEVQAQGVFKVIVNPANTVGSLKGKDVSKLFLRKQTKWADGKAVQPVDQLESAAPRRAFSEILLGMDIPSVKSFWQEVVFSGRGEPPVEKPSDAEVVAYVLANPGAVGYVSGTASVAGVKVISVLP